MGRRCRGRSFLGRTETTDQDPFEIRTRVRTYSSCCRSPNRPNSRSATVLAGRYYSGFYLSPSHSACRCRTTECRKVTRSGEYKTMGSPPEPSRHPEGREAAARQAPTRNDRPYPRFPFNQARIAADAIPSASAAGIAGNSRRHAFHDARCRCSALKRQAAGTTSRTSSTTSQRTRTWGEVCDGDGDASGICIRPRP